MTGGKGRQTAVNEDSIYQLESNNERIHRHTYPPSVVAGQVEPRYIARAKMTDVKGRQTAVSGDSTHRQASSRNEQTYRHMSQLSVVT